ncbi:MAG TPA: acyl-CoA carboxylase subunit epsilon [Cellulomonas sp.]|nr:acyl-CoA carboxylase subunit epsilon [Cellulomonas sp.]
MSDAHVQVVRGAPDDHELAALVAGLMARSSAEPDDDPAAHSAWTDRRRSVRASATWAAGADAWRWSLRG